VRFAVIDIRPAADDDFELIWEMFQEVVRAGGEFAYGPETTREEVRNLWTGPTGRAFIATLDGRPGGTYFVKPNQPGLGSHVANAGFMVAGAFRGHGLGEAMGRHALAEARSLGFRAMQFNFVVSTNRGAVRLWEKLGFTVVGTLPGAFRHSEHGFVDVYVMFRRLD
jgi:GNAT superfamily N-acetyltransferase